MLSYKEELVGDINYPQFDAYLNNTVFVVHNVMATKHSFKQTLRELYRYMKQGFERPEVRKHPLRFKFTEDEAEPEKTMEVRHFIVNLCLWSAFIRYDKLDELNSGQIYDCTNVTEDSLYGYINEHLIAPYRSTIDSKCISKALDDVIYLLSLIYIDFTLIMGLTMDMETFIELRKKYPRFAELLNTKPEPGMQPAEIENMIHERLNEYLDIVTEQDKDNNLRPFIVTGTGINKGQLAQLSIMGGLKPDIEGNVNPTPIDSNFINGGLNSITNFYIDGQAGCKPLILNKTVMGKSGYFSYKTMTLSSNYRLSRTVDDCHTHRLIEFVIKSKKHLNKLDKRYYRFPSEPEDVLHVINKKKDKHLIGQTILLRDPSTCKAHDGICHICYGDLYYTNNDPAFHVGRYAATEINEPIQQKILSSKHMLTTNSKPIEFQEGFERFFSIMSNKINLNMDSDEKLTDWKFFIADDDIYMTDELSGDDVDFKYYVEKFSLINKKTGEEMVFEEKSERGMYLYASTTYLLRKDKQLEGRSFTLGSLNEDLPIAIINVVNNELSTPLKNIIKLLDRKDHFGCNTIDELINKMVQLTIDSGMRVDAVHCSMIIKGLIRDADNILMPPSFDDGEDHYQILTVSKALLFNPSFTVSFSFDNANKQIVNPTTYKKYKPSDYDIHYREDIYDDSEEYYRKKKNEKKLKKLRKKQYKFWKMMYGDKPEYADSYHELEASDMDYYN